MRKASEKKKAPVVKKPSEKKHLPLLVVGGSILLMLFIFLASGGRLANIQPGEVGVKFDARNGSAVSIIQPRIQLYWPWQRLVTYPSSLRTNNYVKNVGEGDRGKQDDSVRALTLAGTTVHLDVSVSWVVQPDQLMEVFSNFGERDPNLISEAYLRPLTYAATNEVVGKMTIEQVLVQRRSELSVLIKSRLTELLNPYGITIEDVNVGEVYPDPAVSESIQQLVAARNNLQQLTKQIETAKEEARKIITDAERQAAENRLRTELSENSILAMKLKLRRIKAERWNGSNVIVGPKPR
jgi:regulator of protease activity HflC (stomatin/prohibitin superfamily)